METAMGYLTEDEGRAWFSSDEKKWKNRIMKLAEEYPEQVKITVYPEDNDGCINAWIPAKWIRVKPPVKRNLTDEQRMAMSERLKKAREAGNEDEEEDEE
jgi:hypothetical protein